MTNIQAHLAAIATLPLREQYRFEELPTEQFQLFDDGRISIYRAPFDFVNRGARVVLLGLTPGKYQFELAIHEAHQALREGASLIDTLRRAKEQASFAGRIRENIITMMDDDVVGLPTALGIASTRDLFADHSDLVHCTSTLRYPVFVNGKNYTGYGPKLMSVPVLVSYVETILTEELTQIPDALIVPFGKAAQSAVIHLIDGGVIAEGRCLLEFPHPSGANGHRTKQFNERKEAFGQRIRDWFAV